MASRSKPDSESESPHGRCSDEFQKQLDRDRLKAALASFQAELRMLLDGGDSESIRPFEGLRLESSASTRERGQTAASSSSTLPLILFDSDFLHALEDSDAKKWKRLKQTLSRKQTKYLVGGVVFEGNSDQPKCFKLSSWTVNRDSERGDVEPIKNFLSRAIQRLAENPPIVFVVTRRLDLLLAAQAVGCRAVHPENATELVIDIAPNA